MITDGAGREALLGQLLVQYEHYLAGQQRGIDDIEAEQLEVDASLAAELQEAKRCLELLHRVRVRGHWSPT